MTDFLTVVLVWVVPVLVVAALIWRAWVSRSED